MQTKSLITAELKQCNDQNFLYRVKCGQLVENSIINAHSTLIKSCLKLVKTQFKTTLYSLREKCPCLEFFHYFDCIWTRKNTLYAVTGKCKLILKHYQASIPVDTRRRFNVYKTSIPRRRRRIDVLQTLKRRHVSTGIQFSLLLGSKDIN